MPKHCPSCARIENDAEYCPSCGTKLVNPDAISSSNWEDETNSDYWVISGRIEHIQIKYEGWNQYNSKTKTHTSGITNAYTFRVNNVDIDWNCTDLTAQNGDYVHILVHERRGACALYNVTTKSPLRIDQSRMFQRLLLGGLVSSPFLCCGVPGLSHPNNNGEPMLLIFLAILIICVTLYYCKIEIDHEATQIKFGKNGGRL